MNPYLTVTAADPNATSSPESVAAPPAPFDATHRYALGAEIARGGMGVVYRATDTVLDREVAVKVLHGRYSPASASAHRFAAEARITGRLQHPNIPAVHDLGTLPDGRPFLAMKLIRGDTLADLLAARTDPAADRGRWVAVFEDVCHGVAYAHAHGVIHRDLKPANVMVGSFGDVQVMDWGLAKVLAGGGSEAAGDFTDPDATVTGSSRDDDLGTQAGSVLGTPAYMPPEQAIGAIDQIDARSDVFGLGGILTAVLTGRPPFEGSTAESTRQLAAKGKVDACFARLDGCGADPELVALCRRCLTPEKGDRPADAGEVARAVREWRAAADVRAREAERERAAAEGRAAEQAKRRRVVVRAAVAIGVVLLLGVAGTTAGLFRANDLRQAAEQAQGEEFRQRRVAQQREEEADAARAAAEAEARRANREAATADQVAGFLVGLYEPQDRLTFGAVSLGFQKSRQGLTARDLLARGVKRLNAAELKEQPLVRARLLHEIGTIYFGLGDPDTAAGLLDEALALRRAHLPPRHPDLARSLSGVAVLRYAVGDWSCIDLLRESIAILKAQPDPESLELAEAESALAVCLHMRAGRESADLFAHAAKVFKARLGPHDLRTLTTIWLLAYWHFDKAEWGQGLALAAEFMTGLEKSSADPRLKEAVRHAMTAVQKNWLGRPAEEVIQEWRDTVAGLGEVLGETHYLTVKAKRGLAAAIYRGYSVTDSRFLEAAKLYEEGMGIGPAWERNLNRFDLARTFMSLGRDAEADELFRQALEQFRKEPPDLFAGYEPQTLSLLARLADRSGDARKQAEVENLLKQAVDAARANEHTPAGRRGLAHRDLGIYRLTRKNDTTTTAALFAEAAENFLKSGGPDHIRRAEALAYQAIVLRAEGKAAEGDALKQEAERITRKHAKDKSGLAQGVRLLLEGKLPKSWW